jgi:hypothetical protein
MKLHLVNKVKIIEVNLRDSENNTPLSRVKYLQKLLEKVEEEISELNKKGYKVLSISLLTDGTSIENYGYEDEKDEYRYLKGGYGSTAGIILVFEKMK